MKWATINACGNDFLLRKAQELNPNALLIPTTIDTEKSHDRVAEHPMHGKLIIGWTGSHSTVQYLHQILTVIKELEKEFDFEFRVISDRKPPFSCKSLHYIKWNKSSEIEDLAAINIGLMPLPEDAWAEGKCGLKALQYMALGIPVLLSPLGVNKQIIIEGMHGYFCEDSQDWHKHLRNLILDRALLRKLGSNTRTRVEEAYSVHANASKFLLLFASQKSK
jgi:glycosyltransferase involved in cell wall biosynthesis